MKHLFNCKKNPHFSYIPEQNVEKQLGENEGIIGLVAMATLSPRPRDRSTQGVVMTTVRLLVVIWRTY